MSAAEPRRWYASEAALRRREYSAALSVFESGLAVLLLPPGPVGEGHAMIARSVVVTGRSAAHVDRLARDWIGHGVTPTTTGGRGVQRPDRPERTPWGWRVVKQRHVLRRFDAAEKRAARVVSR